jgi:hypothetical protein
LYNGNNSLPDKNSASSQVAIYMCEMSVSGNGNGEGKGKGKVHPTTGHKGPEG